MNTTKKFKNYLFYLGHFSKLLDHLTKSQTEANERMKDAEAAIDVLDFITNGHSREHFQVSHLIRLQSHFLSLHQQLAMQLNRDRSCTSLAVGLVGSSMQVCSANSQGRPKLFVNFELVELLHSAPGNSQSNTN